MKVIITGGAGFIGSNFVDVLISKGHNVTVYDNLSCGKEEFLKHHYSNPSFKFVKGDVLDKEKLIAVMKDQDIVFHFAANPDIAKGMAETDLDLKAGIIATYNVLEAMKVNDIKKIVYSSSSMVYGDVGLIKTAEDFGPLFPISMYGASKLGSEGMISAFCHLSGMQAWIFRFANVVGKRQTHGVIYDFIREKIIDNPKYLLKESSNE